MGQIKYHSSYKHILRGKLRNVYENYFEKAESIHPIEDTDIFFIEKIENDTNTDNNEFYAFSTLTENPNFSKYFEEFTVVKTKFWKNGYPVYVPENLIKIMEVKIAEYELREKGQLKNIFIGSDGPVTSIYTSILGAKYVVKRIMEDNVSN